MIYIHCIFSLLLTLSALSVSKSDAHGLGYHLEVLSETPVVEFCYSDGTPASYAEVTVWSPTDKEVEFQNGRTDKNGRFAFSPDTTGIWRIDLTDGMGHASSAECAVESMEGETTNIRAEDNNQKKSRLIPILLGISLIFNIAAVIKFSKNAFSSTSASVGP